MSTIGPYHFDSYQSQKLNALAILKAVIYFFLKLFTISCTFQLMTYFTKRRHDMESTYNDQNLVTFFFIIH
jgi:peroxiredoxin